MESTLCPFLPSSTQTTTTTNNMEYDSGSDDGGEVPHFPRDLPNILITGTPGTGKTTTSEMAAEATGLTHINVGDLVKSKSLHEGLDTEYDSYILDEDKVHIWNNMGNLRGNQDRGPFSLYL